MKAISIQQPWGSLICCGLKDVENRSWALKSTPMRLLIHVGSKRQPIDEKDMPLIWWLPIENAQTMGVIGKMKNMPTSAVIGVATVAECVAESDSVWATVGHGAEYKWVVKDVQLFKQPILNVKGRLGIFDIPEIDENDLPECMETPTLRRSGNRLDIPLAKQEYNRIVVKGDNSIEFNLTDDNLHLFADDNLNPLPTKSVRLHHGHETTPILDVAKVEILPVEDKPGDGAVIFCDAHGNDYEWWRVRITINR